MINIAFTGGGTGGHIYPGLAVAAELKKLMTGSEFRLFWIGSSTGMDRSLVEDAGIEFFGIPSGKLRRYFALRTIVDFFKVVGGFFAARKILKKQMRLKKDKNNKGTKGFLNKTILFSKGGYVSVPPCAAAASLGIPVFTHESDYSPGLATKINARFVSAKGRIFTAYEETKKFFPEKIRERITVSGNPVRSAFRSADPKKGRTFLQVTDNERILLVLGGSQGAHEINELIRKSLDSLTETYTVVHQTGPNLEWDIPKGEKYKPFPYIKEEMPDVMAASELIMGRSGAGIWEWAVLGKPMVLIPLRGSGTRGDQIENARYFEKAGAAQVLSPTDDLPAIIGSIAQDDKKRDEMIIASAKIGQQDGAKIITHILKEGIIDLFND